MSVIRTDLLPSVRIRCEKGRIRVGDRNYLSASEALSVYLQQFDQKQKIVRSMNGSVSDIALAAQGQNVSLGSFDVDQNGFSYLNAADKLNDSISGDMDYLDFQCTPRYGDRRSNCEPVLLTPMLSRRELKVLADDAIREAKLKRLFREASRRSSFDDSSTKIIRQQRNNSTDDGERLVGDLCREDGKLKVSLTETENTASFSSPRDWSSLQKEVEAVLPRSAQLLENVRSRSLLRPILANDVSSHHNADTLLSSTSHSDDPHPHPASTRHSRSRHRYSYHSNIRSLSVDGARCTRKEQPLCESGRRMSADCLPSSLLLEKGRAELKNSMSSVLSDSEDVLKHLKAVSPPHNGLSGQKTWTRGIRARQAGPSGWCQEDTPTTNEQYNSDKSRPSTPFRSLDRSYIEFSFDNQGVCDKETVGEAVHMSRCVKPSEAKERTADDSTDCSYTGPGLSYSDLVTSPARSTTGRRVSNSHRPPRPPGTKSRNKSRIGLDAKDVFFTTRKTALHNTPLNAQDFQDRYETSEKQPDLRLCTETTISGSPPLHPASTDEDPARAIQSLGEKLNAIQSREEEDVSDVMTDTWEAGSTELESSWIPTCSIVNALQGHGETGCEQKAALKISELTGPHPAPTSQIRHSLHLDPGTMKDETAREYTSSMSHSPIFDRCSSLDTVQIVSEKEEGAGLIPALKGYDFELQPGGRSLERALVHLGRLKTLVQTGPRSL